MRRKRKVISADEGEAAAGLGGWKERVAANCSEVNGEGRNGQDEKCAHACVVTQDGDFTQGVATYVANKIIKASMS